MYAILESSFLTSSKNNSVEKCTFAKETKVIKKKTDRHVESIYSKSGGGRFWGQEDYYPHFSTW